jgi:hypothetical protein
VERRRLLSDGQGREYLSLKPRFNAAFER